MAEKHEARVEGGYVNVRDSRGMLKVQINPNAGGHSRGATAESAVVVGGKEVVIALTGGKRTLIYDLKGHFLREM